MYNVTLNSARFEQEDYLAREAGQVIAKSNTFPLYKANRGRYNHQLFT